MDKEYFEAITLENTKVFIRKDHVSAIEEIPGTARTEPYLKLYIAGYHFGLKMKKTELLEILKERS